MKFKIKKGDTVLVITGKEKGKTGPVLRVLGETGRIMVDGINMYKKFVRSKATQRSKPESTLVERPRSLAMSNVALVCTACKKATRVGYKIEGDTKSRICKKCNATI